MSEETSQAISQEEAIYTRLHRCSLEQLRQLIRTVSGDEIDYPFANTYSCKCYYISKILRQREWDQEFTNALDQIQTLTPEQMAAEDNVTQEKLAVLKESSTFKVTDFRRQIDVVLPILQKQRRDLEGELKDIITTIENIEACSRRTARFTTDFVIPPNISTFVQAVSDKKRPAQTDIHQICRYAEGAPPAKRSKYG